MNVASGQSTGFLGRLGWGHRGFRVRSPRLAILGLCLLLLVPFVSDQLAFQTRMQQHTPDLRFWLENAETLMADPGQPFYPRFPFYIYPPFFLTLIWPLTKLPPTVAAAVFETTKWLALVWGLRLAWRLASRPGEDPPPIVALGSLVLTWRFIDNDFGQGNVNLLLLWAMLGAVWLVSRGRPLAAGAVVAIAASIKITPALLLLYFLYKGWWRTWIGAVSGLLVCLLIWPAVFVGWESNLRLLGEWYQAVVAGFVEHGAVRSEHANQALVAIINRLFGTHPAFVSTEPDQTPHVYLTIVALPPWARDGLRAILALGLLGGLAWFCRGRLDPRRHSRALGAEVGLVLVTMLLLSGLSWKAHYVTMLLPYSVLLAYVADGRHPPGQRRVVGVLLAASFALCTLTSDIITPRGADYAEALGLIALGAIAAAGSLALLRTQLRRVTIAAAEGGPPAHPPPSRGGFGGGSDPGDDVPRRQP